MVDRQVEGFALGIFRHQRNLAEVGRDALGEETYGGVASPAGGGVRNDDEKQGAKQAGHG